MIELLYSAVHSTHGIAVETEDPLGLRQKLYAARKELADPALDILSFSPSPTVENQLWIWKNEKKV